MTDEVNLDNLDALADLPDSADAAVEADPVADAAVDSINDNAEEQPVAAEDAVESDTAENDAEASGDADEQESEELDAGAKAVEEFSKSLRTLEGKWYVLHTYSGYEKRVKTNVESPCRQLWSGRQDLPDRSADGGSRQAHRQGQEGHHPRACSWLRADSYVAG